MVTSKKTFLPSGRTGASELQLSPYVARWETLHNCRRVISEGIVSAKEQIYNSKLAKYKIAQKDRLAKRCSCNIFDVVETFGLAVNVSGTDFPTLFKALKVSATDAETRNLDTLIEKLLFAVHESQSKEDSPLKYNDEAFRSPVDKHFDMIDLTLTLTLNQHASENGH